MSSIYPLVAALLANVIAQVLKPITCVFSFIVIYDAANVRYYAGRNIQLTKQLISDLETLKGLKFNDPIYHEKIKSVLGHKFIEILGGILLGILVSLSMYQLIH